MHRLKVSTKYTFYDGLLVFQNQDLLYFILFSKLEIVNIINQDIKIMSLNRHQSHTPWNPSPFI